MNAGAGGSTAGRGAGGMAAGGSAGSTGGSGAGEGGAGAGGATSCFMGREPNANERLYARVCETAWDACAAKSVYDFDVCGCILWGGATERLCYDDTLAFFACMDGQSASSFECSFATVIPVDGVCTSEFDTVLGC